MGDFLDDREVVPPAEGEDHGEEGMVWVNLHIYYFTSQMAKRTTWKKVCFSSHFICRPQLSDIS